MRPAYTKISILLGPPISLIGRSRLIAVGTFISAMALLTSPGVALGPFIDRFEATPDCIFPDPRRGILSYMVSLASRVRIYAVEELRLPFGRRLTQRRAFYDVPASFPSRDSGGIADPGATAIVVAYELVATGEGGRVATRRLDFRYRRAAFDLLPPVSHFRGTGPDSHETRYESDASLVNVRSLTCSFQFDRPIAGEPGRAGTARIFEVRRGDQWVSCFIAWSSTAKARAGGTVEWTARVRDGCTQGRISRSARANPIP